MTTPFVSVVVPVLNGGKHLGELLRSLAALDWPADRLEILVVDNGSTDDTAEQARAAGVTLLSEPERGASRARNRGIREARGEIVAFTDADCLVTRRWIRGVTAPFQDPVVGGVGGRIETYRPTTLAERYAARIGHLDVERHLSHPTFPFAPTANAAFRRDVFEKIGGFDPDFPWGEPVDFGKRVVRDAGFRLAFAPTAVVLHRARASVAEFRRQQEGYGYSLALLCSKYRDEVVWDVRRDREADAEVSRAFWRMPSAFVTRPEDGDRRATIQNRWLDWVRAAARRRGFRRAVRERGLVFNRGAA
ncbi:MAG TPA: glycosyltransferase [Candidatus Eisenbacteria bacterium]